MTRWCRRRRQRLSSDHPPPQPLSLPAMPPCHEDGPAAAIAIDDIEATIREAGHEWPRETIIKVVNHDLAGIGSGKNAPRSVPILERLSSGRFKLL